MSGDIGMALLTSVGKPLLGPYGNQIPAGTKVEIIRPK